MHTLIDIQNNLLKYGENEILIILDNSNEPWFSASSVTNILEHTNTAKALADNVDPDDRTTFNDLKKFIKVIPPNSQPHAVYINESGSDPIANLLFLKAINSPLFSLIFIDFLYFLCLH